MPDRRHLWCGIHDPAMVLDLSRERADTRLLPGAKAVLEYRRRVDRPGLRARVSVVVYPDAFYIDFFESLLAQGAGRGEAQIREALAETRRSAFTIFERELPLTHLPVLTN